MASSRALLAGCAAVLSLVTSSVARADDTIKTPGDHPSYPIEVEPHLTLGFDNVYYNSGFGVGARFAIPIVENGFVPSINNSVAIGFGADFLHYDYCYVTFHNCSANALLFPVVLQWNFYVAQKWSVFGEPGLYFYKFFFDSSACNNVIGPCGAPSSFGVLPAIFLGGRYYFSEHITLTMRIGYPTFSIGVSFM